jgi:signal transduction histidine kinase
MTLVLVVVARQFVMVNEQQNLTIERMRSIDEMKNNFLRAVSHELRTPLTFIEGAASMIVDEGDDLPEDVRKDMMERLLRNSRRLDHLLVGLLDLGRITQGILEPARSVTDLGDLIQRVALDVQDEAHPITVHTSHTLANIDQIQAERIIENLLVNAMRHTPDGTQISAEARRTDDGVLISIEDGGPGVPEHVRESIFQPFVQAQPAVDAGRGTGIGLALVARFAELHGGRAWVEEGESGGAKFQVLLADDAGDPSPVAA